jgi:hypothetical protein
MAASSIDGRPLRPEQNDHSSVDSALQVDASSSEWEYVTMLRRYLDMLVRVGPQQHLTPPTNGIRFLAMCVLAAAPIGIVLSLVKLAVHA